MGGRKVWGLPVRVIRAANPLLFSALSPYYSVLTLLVSLLLVLALLNTTATHPLTYSPVKTKGFQASTTSERVGFPCFCNPTTSCSTHFSTALWFKIGGKRVISKSTFLISLERIETIAGRDFYSLKHRSARCNVRSEFACPVNCSMSQRSRPSDCSSSNLGLLNCPIRFISFAFILIFILSRLFHFVLIAGLF